MLDLSFYVGIIGNIISCLMFLSPASTFKRIIERRDTEGFKSIPYICTLLSSSLWTYYGIIKPEVLVSTINGFGALVQIFYIIVFLIFAPSRTQTLALVGIVNVGFCGAAVVVPKLALQGSQQVDALGFICAALNIVMYASPLSAMKTVVTTKSVEYMPFFLSLFMFFNGATWTFYAILRWDIFLLVPNGVGCFLGAVQLVLYATFRNTKASKGEHLSEKLIEEGSHEQSTLISSSSSKTSKKDKQWWKF